MGWTLILGVAVLVGLGCATSEYDSIPLETSPGGYSRKSAPRPIFTASYGIAPGEYVLRGSDNDNSPSPIQGFRFLPRDQEPPQEYLDLLRQTGASVDPVEGKQQKGASRVIDQQYFDVQPSAPYPASGPSPVAASGPSQVQESNVPPSPPYPSTGQDQVFALNLAQNSPYPTSGNSPISTLNVSPKPNAASNNRNILPSRSSSSQGASRQGAGKAVQVSYSLDYDLRTLHTIGESAGRNADSSSSSAPNYQSGPGTTVRGNGELLNQLAPQSQPIPFLPSFDSSQDRKKPKTKSSSSSVADNEKDKIEVIKLPSPRGQRPITQKELLELIQAGYDVRPVEESSQQRYQTTQQPPQSGYQRAVVPQNPLRLPKSRGLASSSPSTGYIRASKTQETTSPQQTYLSQTETAPSAGGSDSAYYQTRPVPLPLLRQQNIQPDVQTYQPGTSGIQQVDQHQSQQAEPQPQIQQTPESYVSQTLPSAAAQQQQEYQHLGRQQVLNYPTAAAQQPQEYQQISGQQAQLYQQSADPQVQVYQQPTATQSRNEALSQPKEYVVPVPTRSYGTRGRQQYQPTSPSASGTAGSLTYQHALGASPQSYDDVPTAPGATAPGGEIQRTHPRYGRRNSRRRQSSQRDSPVTYIQRHQGDSTGYSTEQ